MYDPARIPRHPVAVAVLRAPRLADRYPTHGVIATIEQVGRLPGGAPAAVLRAGQRALT